MHYAARASKILSVPGVVPWVAQILRINLSKGFNKDERLLCMFLLDRLHHTAKFNAQVNHPAKSWTGCLGCDDIFPTNSDKPSYRVTGCCNVCLPIHGYNHFNTGTIYAGVFNTFGGYLEH